MCRVTLFIALCGLFQNALSVSKFPNFYRELKIIPTENCDEYCEPLILTPLIEEGKIAEAKEAARVKHEAFFNITHYTGFFTVNKTYNANLFTWFIPSENDSLSDPVVLWLQGGPGSSSLFALFAEHGPFKMKNENGVVLRNESWSKTNNMIYIDNPVGTGYSFTDQEGLVHDEDRVGEDLYEAIRQFFLLFPELRENEFFITGESYGGHYVPAVSHKIHQKNLDLPANQKINLKGLAIGNGWTDPINQLNYGEYLYQHGMVDVNTKKIMDQYRDATIELIRKGEYAAARDENDKILETFTNTTDFVNYYNYLFAFDQDDEPIMDVFIQRCDIRQAIHVGNSQLHSGAEVNEALNADVMKSVVHLLPELIANYRVLLYSGQVDIIVAYPLTMNYLEKLEFNAAKEYKTAKRIVWYVDNDIAGFAKSAGNLTEVLVRDAGHMVPTDQPAWAFDLINRFTRNISFDVRS